MLLSVAGLIAAGLTQPRGSIAQSHVNEMERSAGMVARARRGTGTLANMWPKCHCHFLTSW